MNVRDEIRIGRVSSSVCPQNLPIDYFSSETEFDVRFSTLKAREPRIARKYPESRALALGTMVAIALCGTA
jgi:hypothetical protein